MAAARRAIHKHNMKLVKKCVCITFLNFNNDDDDWSWTSDLLVVDVSCTGTNGWANTRRRCANRFWRLTRPISAHELRHSTTVLVLNHQLTETVTGSPVDISLLNRLTAQPNSKMNINVDGKM